MNGFTPCGDASAPETARFTDFEKELYTQQLVTDTKIMKIEKNLETLGKSVGSLAASLPLCVEASLDARLDPLVTSRLAEHASSLQALAAQLVANEVRLGIDLILSSNEITLGRFVKFVEGKLADGLVQLAFKNALTQLALASSPVLLATSKEVTPRSTTHLVQTPTRDRPRDLSVKDFFVAAAIIRSRTPHLPGLRGVGDFHHKAEVPFALAVLELGDHEFDDDLQSFADEDEYAVWLAFNSEVQLVTPSAALGEPRPVHTAARRLH